MLNHYFGDVACSVCVRNRQNRPNIKETLHQDNFQYWLCIGAGVIVIKPSFQSVGIKNQSNMALNLLISVRFLRIFLGEDGMKQLSKTVSAVIFGLGFAAFAQANQYKWDLGELSFSNSLSGSGSSGSASGNFNDWFTFTVSQDVLASNVNATVVIFNGSQNFGVQNLEIAVYKGSYTGDNLNGLLSKDLLGSFKIDGSGTSVFGTFNFDPACTSYTFLISGETKGASANYIFGMAAAVPEPAEYAMMLAGLGIVGMAARRRKVTVN